MNTIESTTKHNKQEDAEDAVAGLRSIQGFIFGYVRHPSSEGGDFQAVTIFNCAGDDGPVRGQRRVTIPSK
jgi:hypothetical protein